jgi:hypothetical protein
LESIKNIINIISGYSNFKIVIRKKAAPTPISMQTPYQEKDKDKEKDRKNA